MSTVLFDPRSERYKTPFGAVPCGTAVTFCFRPDTAAVRRVVLVTHCEFSDRWMETELSAAAEGENTVFRGVYSASDTPELVWYHFRLFWADGGESCYGAGGHQSRDSVTPWQLTVYDGSRKTPGWFARGVTYQIFPDRFFRAKKRSAAGLVGSRTLHESWDEPVEYRPDAHGEITCSDFFGGDLAGITQKLDYLVSLGVTALYLNPIFEASTNHRYDTANYKNIDPLLGTEEDFKTLCAEAKSRGIRVILDGVFNHTGAKSIYFNADGFYPTPGAAQGKGSPYYDWYRFHSFPDDYDSWWGIKNLPAVEESNESYVNYMVNDRDSVVRRWLRLGASGWRLDVADELPDEFIAAIRAAMDEERPDSLLIGEVWEDGSNKIAYSRRRKYLLGSETHALMNYPFRTAALSYLRGGDAADFQNAMETLRENYPPSAFYSAMNFLSTHDTPRLLTVLGLSGKAPETRDERASFRLSPAEYARGVERVKLAAVLLYTFPGAPTLYYGDEAGMEGFEDPFNRATYPWGRENRALVRWFARLGALRRQHAALQCGTIRYLHAGGSVLAFLRQSADDRCLTVLNAGDTPVTLSLPWDGELATDALTSQQFLPQNGTLRLTLGARGGLLLV